jgi:branched-chain amino acid transport system ATP-binding protein
VKLGGVDLANKRPEVIRAAGIAAVPEGHQVLTQLTVEENLMAAGSMFSKNDLKKAVTEALVVFPELESKLIQRAGSLSGGQQQMLALAQALISKPGYLLADELSLGLAPLIVSRLIRAIEGIAQSGVGVLLIEQFTTVALNIAHHAYILDRGAICFAGSPAEIKADPSVLHAAYLSGSFASSEKANR